jgi:hypothetical protein
MSPEFDSHYELGGLRHVEAAREAGGSSNSFDLLVSHWG